MSSGLHTQGVAPPHSNQADATLLIAWRDGDARAGQQLMRRYLPELRRFFSHKLSQDGEDLAQSTFLALMNSRSVFRREASFRTYLLVIARHELYRHLRKRKRAEVSMAFVRSSPQVMADPPCVEFAEREVQSLVREALRQLPSDTREALRSFFEIDTGHVVVSVLTGLMHAGEVDASTVADAIARYGIDPDKADPFVV